MAFLFDSQHCAENLYLMRYDYLSEDTFNKVAPTSA